MRRSFTVAGIAAVTLLGLTLPATAITGNYVKDDVHDGVGLLVTYDEDGEFAGRCSGTLLTPTVFLTAAHCTDGKASARVYFEQDAGVGYVPATDTTEEILAPSGYPEEGGVTASILHTPDAYDDFATFPNTWDVALVILDEAQERDRYAAMLAAGSLDELATGKAKPRVAFTVSGYGLNYVNGAQIISYRERMMATATLVNLKSNATAGHNLAHTGNASQGKGGTCFGDSGGPVFLKDSWTIAGITSFGMSAMTCSGPGFAYRTDQADVIEWVEGHIPAGETLLVVAP